jgi:predicted membrane protein DUF2232
MRSGFFIGLGSGVASAFLSYSATRGSSPLLIILLGLLTPLPSLIAGLGWGWLSAAAAAAMGALVTGIFAGAAAAAGYFLMLGLPTTMIAYLVYLSRPDPYDSEAREFYPPGRLTAAMALYAGALPVLFLPLIGGSYEGVREPIDKELRTLSQRLPELGMKSLSNEQVQALTDLFINKLPGALAAYWLIVFTLNAYLAGRIALASGRLGRDWPDIPAMAYPVGFPVLMALAVLAMYYAPGALGIAGTSFTGALLLAYLIAGLALAHFIARGRAPWALWLVYAALILLTPYAAMAIILGGLVDAVFKLKQRLGAPPPSS